MLTEFKKCKAENIRGKQYFCEDAKFAVAELTKNFLLCFWAGATAGTCQ